MFFVFQFSSSTDVEDCSCCSASDDEDGNDDSRDATAGDSAAGRAAARRCLRYCSLCPRNVSVMKSGRGVVGEIRPTVTMAVLEGCEVGVLVTLGRMDAAGFPCNVPTPVK